MQKKHHVAVIIDSITGIGGFQKEVWEGISDCSEENHTPVTFFCGGELGHSPENEFEKFKNFIYDFAKTNIYDGYIIVGGTLANRIIDEKYQEFLKKFLGKPCVSVGPSAGHLCEILSDNKSGIKAILEHLIQHHKISDFAFVSGTENNVDAQIRYKAFLSILEANGIEFFDNYYFQGDWTNDSGRRAVDFFMEDKENLPKAIVCANDNMALGVLDRFNELGINVPNEIAVTGFDDIEDTTSILPALTTVRQNIYELGRKALLVLLDNLASGTEIKNHAIPCNLMVRQSCGCMLNVMKQEYGIEHASLSDPADLSKIRVKVFDKIISVLSNLKRIPPNELILAMVNALYDLDNEKLGENFLLAFENCLRWSFFQNETISVWQNVVSVMVRAAEQAEISANQKQKLSDLFHQARILISEIAVQMQKRQRRMMQKKNDQIVTIGSNVSTSFTFPDLNDNLGELISRINVPSIFINVFDENLNDKTSATTRSAFTSDLSVKENYIEELIVSENLVPARFSDLPQNRIKLVFPITFRTNQLGFCIFGQGTRDGLIYENLLLQMGNTVQRIQLLEHIQKTEAELLRKNQKIEDLITPMLDSFESIKQAAFKEDTEFRELMLISRENISTIEKAVKISAVLNRALQEATALVKGIDDISETINLVALNASIEAAHAGTYGRGFKVIANEIRKLSDASKKNADSIELFLNEVNTGVTEFVSTIDKTKSTFDQLTGVIEQTANSFKFIIDNMSEMTGKSDTVLKIMKE